ncbi:MAG: hemerythrin domain-containing protein [Pirellulaceae bacterium]|jgi:iron-sulfur cluster repair protein YtfE (RIC family)|nr:hemerythrin domain-containing protein [Pirellulaceae bacterium]MDP7018840.1 hemerythrin domain-containing protein [Pirellulaceae bacterium]
MKATSSKAVSLNAAFLDEIKQVHEELNELLSSLRVIAHCDISDATSRRLFVDSLGAMRDQLALRFSLEDAYGYIENPVDAAPWLTEVAAELRDEHSLLYRQASRLSELAESMWRSEQLAQRWQMLLAKFMSFDDQLTRHETRENELVIAVCNEDVGVGD